MHTTRKLRRWISLIVLSVLAFAQANLALAGCELDRRALTQITVSEAADDGACGMNLAGQAPFSSNRCAAHCTADLQIAGVAAAIVRGASESSILQVPRSTQQLLIRTSRDTPPSAAVPIRILLHSFLI